MRVLVLGGTRFVGRALVEEALRRGDEVTTVNRGVSGAAAVGVEAVYVDRRDGPALAAALAEREWDVVVDTWSGAASVVATSARLLAQRVGYYGYVSSRSVYRWPVPVGADESAAVVDGDPDGQDGADYAAAKRGGELAVLESFDGRALVARAGLVLGPYENVGRLPWWLGRIARGGQVLAPGPPERGLQYVDARDLAAWILDAARRRAGGILNAVSPPGHTSTGQLLRACVEVTGADAELVWVTPEVIAECGIAPWTDLPIWAPPTGELAGLHAADASAARLRGLVCRPVQETVSATWDWLRREGSPTPPPDRPAPGIAPETERRCLHVHATAQSRSLQKADSPLPMGINTVE